MTATSESRARKDVENGARAEEARSRHRRPPPKPAPLSASATHYPFTGTDRRTSRTSHARVRVSQIYSHLPLSPCRTLNPLTLTLPRRHPLPSPVFHRHRTVAFPCYGLCVFSSDVSGTVSAHSAPPPHSLGNTQRSTAVGLRCTTRLLCCCCCLTDFLYWRRAA